jgi:steroid 5-alpha reductase family enzyme
MPFVWTYPAYPPDFPPEWQWTSTPWGMMLIGLCLVMFVMSGVSIVANRWKNAGLVDIFWALGFVGLALLYGELGHGWQPRQLLVNGTLFIANFRLAMHLYKRFQPTVEDGRYAALRQSWMLTYSPSQINTMFTAVILGQGVLLTLLTAPIAMACPNPTPYFYPVEIMGGLVWLLGMIVAAVADNQLARFKRHNTDKQAVCDTGLWAYSRHPNYLGEWLTWVGYWLMACGSPYGVWSVFVPGAMYVLLRYLSGVGATESLALATKGEAYRRYQQRVPVFFPKKGI